MCKKIETREMMQDSDIEASVSEMLAFVEEKAPILRPAIFLRSKVPKSPLDLVRDGENQKKLSEKWLHDGRSVLFKTEVDYKNKRVCLSEIRYALEIDAKLGNLEAMMKLLVEGTVEELAVATTRFLEVNGYTEENKSNNHLLYAVCNVSYAIKVLLSNAPMKTVLKANKKEGTPFHNLPLAAGVDIVRALDFVTVCDKEEKKRSTEDSDDSSRDDSEEEAKNQKRKKKRKRASRK